MAIFFLFFGWGMMMMIQVISRKNRSHGSCSQRNAFNLYDEL